MHKSRESLDRQQAETSKTAEKFLEWKLRQPAKPLKESKDSIPFVGEIPIELYNDELIEWLKDYIKYRMPSDEEEAIDKMMQSLRDSGDHWEVKELNAIMFGALYGFKWLKQLLS